MTSLFTTYYSKTLNAKPQGKIRVVSMIRWLIRCLSNSILPIYYKLTSNNASYRLHPCEKTSNRIVVSMSSFPARIDKIWICIESLLRQSVKPDLFILWLSRKQFPNEYSDLPRQLATMQKRGISIRFVDEDYRSHRKYHYVLQEHQNDLIITVDDDIFYHPHLIEQLVSGHKENPSAIIAAYTHGKLYDSNGHLLPYQEWNNNAIVGDLFLGSGGGTLFPPKSLYPDVTDILLALRLCPTADDIWLNMMAKLQHTSILHTCTRTLPLPILSRHEEKLSTVNVSENRNDKQLEAIQEYYQTIL